MKYISAIEFAAPVINARPSLSSAPKRRQIPMRRRLGRMLNEKAAAICDIFLYTPHKCVYFAAFYINFSLPVVGGDRLEPYRRATGNLKSGETSNPGDLTSATADHK